MPSSPAHPPTSPTPGRGDAPPTLSAAAEHDLWLRGQAQLLAKVRSVSGSLVRSVPASALAVRELPATEVSALVQMTRVLDALCDEGPASVRRTRPARWNVIGAYSGVMVQRASTREGPVGVEGLLPDGSPRDVPPDYVLAGGGWVERGRPDGTWWLRDVDRLVERTLLELLCEDPLARLSLLRLDPTLGGFPPDLIPALLGEELPAPGPAKRRWWNWRR